jgi:thymidylate synthase
VAAPSQEDAAERKMLMESLDVAVKQLAADKTTRRAVFPIANADGTSRCISLVHFYSSDSKKISMSAYYRSMCEKNAVYDMQTLALALSKVAEAVDLKPQTIIAVVANLHTDAELKNKIAQPKPKAKPAVKPAAKPTVKTTNVAAKAK